MTIILALAITLTYQAAVDREPQLWEVVRQSSRIFGGCIIDYTRRLEPSGEAANIVVDAALSECGKEREFARRAVSMHSVINGGMTEDRAAETADAGVAQWDADYRKQAVREVVRIRAARNSN